MIINYTCSRCRKHFSEHPYYIGRTKGRAFMILDMLCEDCGFELLKWILKGTEDIQKTQDIEQAQLDKAYEIGYQIGYEEGKHWKEKEEE